MIAAVVLAAGAATRFGSPKQQLLVDHVLERVRASSVDEIVVVSGAYSVETEAPIVHCSDWVLGPGASLRCGLEALPAGAQAAIVALADGPDLAPAAIDRLIEAWREGAGDVLAASYGGERGHPVLLARSVWNAVPDEGARALTPVLVPCDDLGAPGDVDYPGDLPDSFRHGIRLLVFLHGTTIMHSTALGRTRVERVAQVVAGTDAALRDFASYVPVGGAVAKLRRWREQGAEICYLSSHRNTEDVAADAHVLRTHNFPTGGIFARENGESYGDVVARVRPDILIEDDCESIGAAEITYPQIDPDVRATIQSIVVPEFGGIDHLPDSLPALLAPEVQLREGF